MYINQRMLRQNTSSSIIQFCRHYKQKPKLIVVKSFNCMLLTVIPAVIVGICLGVTKMEGYGTEQL